MSNRVLLTNLVIITMDQSRTTIPDGSIGIENDTIAFVCKRGDEPQGWHTDATLDLSGRIAIPGLINAHTHAAMTLLRGYADDMALMEWLNDRIWPFEACLTPDDIYFGTLLACAEMIRSGTTTFSDMYMHMDSVAEAVKVSGLRALLCRGLVGAGPDADEVLADAMRFYNRWHHEAHGRIMACLGPHAPYTCPQPFLERVASEAMSSGLMIHTHLSETMDEVKQIREAYGQSPVEYMRRTGLFECPTLAAHCIHLDDEDIRILADHGVAVVHNPGSNMKLGSGIARVVDMRGCGIVVGLGTDGAASNNNLDMIEEARLCSLLEKLTPLKPTAISAEDALAMATIEGAKALRIDDVTGSLEAGKQADIVVFNTSRPHMTPMFSAVSNIVYSANPGDIEYVFVSGQMLLRQGRVIAFDEQQAIEECRNRCVRLAREAKSR